MTYTCVWSNSSCGLPSAVIDVIEGDSSEESETSDEEGETTDDSETTDGEEETDGETEDDSGLLLGLVLTIISMII